MSETRKLQQLASRSCPKLGHYDVISAVINDDFEFVKWQIPLYDWIQWMNSSQMGLRWPPPQARPRIDFPTLAPRWLNIVSRSQHMACLSLLWSQIMALNENKSLNSVSGAWISVTFTLNIGCEVNTYTVRRDADYWEAKQIACHWWKK